MFAITINGSTPEELYSNLAKLLASQPGAKPSPVYPVNPAPPVSNTAIPAPVAPSGAVPAAPIMTPALAAPGPVPTTVQPATAQPAYVPPAPASPGVPQASAPAYTLEDLAKAGATLAQSGKMGECHALLTKYNVPSVTQLPPEQYGAFATELRALGAPI